MHDPFCTLDLKLYSFLPGGQIYILLFLIFFFLQSASLNHIIRKKAPRWSEASFQIRAKARRLCNITGTVLMTFSPQSSEQQKHKQNFLQKSGKGRERKKKKPAL